ncbi:MAG: acetate--CoA ligase family protein [Pseudomonadota bacterium]
MTTDTPAAGALAPLFSPASVAVVGASQDTGRIRGRLLKLLIEGGFKGPIYPVNPSRSDIQGLRAYASVRDLPEPVELALVAVAADQVMDVLEQCAQRGVKAAAIFSAGSNDRPVGDRLQDHVAAFARRTGVRVLGPNCEGFLDTAAGLTATFSPTLDAFRPHAADDLPRRGRISIVSQSGAMAFALYSRAHRENIPLRHLVSTGNEADVDILDVVDYLVARRDSSAILLFIEGLHHPERFAEVAARAADAGIPLVVAKVGRSGAGQRAAISHTAHMTGADVAYDTVFRRYGVIRVDDPEQMLAVAAAASAGAKPRGKRVAIITTSGGAGGWAADLCEQGGLDVPVFEPAFKAQLADAVPGYGSAENPVDVTAQVVEDGGKTLLGILRRMRGAPGIDICLVILSMTSAGRITSIEEPLAALMADAGIPLVFHSPGVAAPAALAALARLGSLHLELRGFVFAVQALHEYRVFQAQWQEARHSAVRPPAAPSAVLRPEAGGLGPDEARALLSGWGVLLPAQVLARNAADAVVAAGDMGWPVALKIVSADIAHKTEAGGVALDLHDAEALRAAYAGVTERVKAYAPHAAIDGLQVQKMMPPGRELVVGTVNDPDFGPIVMLGLGGIYVEVLRDMVFELAPMQLDQAHRMIRRLKAFALLEGVRGEAAADIPALAELLVRVSEMASAHRNRIVEMDLNPVLLYEAGQGACAVDTLIVVR